MKEEGLGLRGCFEECRRGQLADLVMLVATLALIGTMGHCLDNENSWAELFIL